MIVGKYAKKDDIPAGLEDHYKEINGEWVVEGDEAAAEVLNPQIAAKNAQLLAEAKTAKTQYQALVATSSRDDVENAKKIAQLEKKASESGLPEEDKKLLDAVKEAMPNAKPDDVKKQLTEFPALQTKVETYEKATENEKLFTASGFKNRTVFETLINNPAFNPNFDKIVWKDEKDAKTGNAIKVPYVQVKSAIDGKVEFSIQDYAKNTSEWTAFSPALNAGNGDGGGQEWLPAQPQTHNTGPQLGGGTSGAPSNPFFDAVSAGQAAKSKPPEASAQETQK